MLLLQCEIDPFDQTELAELENQITELSKENKIWVCDSLYGAPIFFAKKRMDDYVYALIMVLWIKIQYKTPTHFHVLSSYFPS